MATTIFFGEGYTTYSFTNGRTYGVKVKFNQDVDVSKLYLYISDSNSSMEIQPRIWDENGALIASGPSLKGVFTSSFQYLPLNSKVKLTANKYYTIGFYNLGATVYINVSKTTTVTINGDYSTVLMTPYLQQTFSRTSDNSPDTVWADYLLLIGVEMNANTAPTTPGAFTQPTGNLETGDPKVFSVGSSSDAEGNLSKYIWEASINGGAFSKIGETSTNNITYTIPTASSLKIRVKAVDSQGLESAYRESAVFTVTKPKYYWSKYNITKLITYTQKPWGNTGSASFDTTQEYYSDYEFDSVKGIFKGVGTPKRYDYATSIPSSSYYIYGNGKYMWKKTGIVNINTLTVDMTEVQEKSSDVRGSLIQSGIIAEEGTYPTDGQQDGYWWVRGSRVNQSIAPPAPFTAPVVGTIFKPSETANIAFGATTAPNLSLYEVDYRYNENAWTPMAYNNTLARQLEITTNKTLTKLQFRVRSKNTSGVYSDYIYSDIFEIQHNTSPVVTLNTEDNLTLYENDIFVIDGQAVDKDSGDFVNVRYKINGGEAQALGTGISNGADTIPFSKKLTFKAGKLYDGDKPLTDELEEGPAHTLRVWAEDGKPGNPVEVTRTFFVVPNRVPELTVDTIEQKSELINSDKISISGTCSDPDGNDVKVTYKINGGLGVEIYSGKDNKWSFDLSLSLLQTGENKVVIEVIDSYNFKASKTVKLYKTEKQTPLTASTARYKINPPSGRAKGVLLWLQREKDLNVSVEISMGLEGEQEQYVPMTLDKSAPVSEGVVEDQFIYQVNESKDNIILKINLSRDSLDVGDSIVLVAGVLE